MITDDQSPLPGSGEMFDAIAARYDLLNRIVSFGVDRGWRRRAVDALRLEPGARILDVATGTADVAIEIARRGAGITVDGVDPSRKMLELGRRKIDAAGLGERVRLHEGTAEELPFDDGVFAGAAIAFGIRNVPDRPRALRELRRVLAPGGPLAVLELTEPQGGPLSVAARIHVHRVVPFVGGLLNGPREYAYLRRSIAAFPPPGAFFEMMAGAGFDVVEVAPLTFGVAHLFVGRRPRG